MTKETPKAKRGPSPKGTRKRPRRPSYSKLVDELMADWERERAHELERPTPEPYAFPPHTEVDEYGFPVDGSNAEDLPWGSGAPGPLRTACRGMGEAEGMRLQGLDHSLNLASAHPLQRSP
jgi:hypothetical protein